MPEEDHSSTLLFVYKKSEKAKTTACIDVCGFPKKVDDYVMGTAAQVIARYMHALNAPMIKTACCYTIAGVFNHPLA